ncbi:MAG: hypothetical protein HW384_2023, partial [Dehalococcoidia bacterium]|nr:hypothetical protein [Dehalococcoidia bacterium]
MYITLFEVPIYLRTSDEYYKDQQAFGNLKINKFSIASGKTPEEERKWLQENYPDYLWWPPWAFNDIVGWVNINYDGRYFAEGWKLNRRRISRDPRHRRGNIVYFGKISEQPAGASN